jgi:uncharacterized protein YqgV (UPF0045/DUF77 family)
MIVEIQVLPSPIGNTEAPFAHVDAAIAVIQASGLRYEVGALGTTVEGAPDDVWPLLRSVHEATIAAGAADVVSVIKAFSAAGDAGPSADDLTAKFRG